MTELVRRIEDIQKDTDSILDLVKSRVYSVDRLNDSGKDKYNSCMEEIKGIQSQIVQLCPKFRVDIKDGDFIVTVSVNRLVVAACTMYLRNHPKGVRYFHVHTHCKMGPMHNVQTYLLQEAERYALSKGVHYMSIGVPMTKMILHANIGFVPYPVEDMPGMSEGKKFQILEVYRQALEDHRTVYANQELSKTNTFQGMRKRPVVLDILRYTINYTVMEKIRNNDPGLIHLWTRRIVDEGSDDLIRGGYIMLSKKLIKPSRIDPYPIVFPKGAIVSTLSDRVDRSMEIIRVNTYDLVDMASTLSEEKTLDLVCQDVIGENYINSLNNGVPGENTVITVEVSNVILGFCIITIENMEINDNGKRQRSGEVPDSHVMVHLICARKFAGIGKRLLDSAARFSAANGAKVMTLNALPHVINWYHNMGFTIGSSGDSETPHMEKVVKSIFRVMDNLKKGVGFEDSIQEPGSKNLETPENLEVLKRLEDLVVNHIFSSDKKTAEEFIERYRGFLLLRADYLRSNDVMDEDDEWEEMVDVGLPMSKRISV